MPDIEAPKTPVSATAPPGALRIVLFGLPGAGKSSLLGALSQAAQAQEHLLNSHLTDLSQGLAELRQRLYDENAQRTADEVVPYAVDFEPLGSDSQRQNVHTAIIDCDGRVANDLLVRHKALDENSPEGTLAHEVLEADALVLVVDASAPTAQIDADFTEFDRFLRQMEQQRGQRTEVSGLPVFLVLTKCDLLAKPDDTVVDWVEKIEQRKREVDVHFRDFLAQRKAAAGSVPFGQIELRLWATAVKRPALRDTPPRPREPYGVAELFRQCLDEAEAFRARSRQADRRLYWVTGSMASLVIVLASVMGFLLVRPLEPAPTELQIKIAVLQATERPTPAERLRGAVADLKSKREQFVNLKKTDGFDALPAADKEYVQTRLDELSEYIAYLEKLLQLPRPAEADRLPRLQEIQRMWQDKDLEPPHPEWANTDAAAIRREAIEDAALLPREVERVLDWYVRDSYAKAHSLWLHAGEPTPGTTTIKWADWQKEADELLNPKRDLPFTADQRLPGSERLTYAVVFRFAEVVEAKARWEGMKPRLNRARNLAAALGMTPASVERPALLVFEATTTMQQARAALQALQMAYPTYRADFVRAGLPDSFLKALDEAAKTNFDNLLVPAREVILQHLRQTGTGPEETPTRWNAVRDWLSKEPEELAAWRTLALLLARLRDPEAVDPVSDLAAFLQKTTFAIDIKRMTLRVPEDLNIKVPPTAQLSVFHPPTNEKDAALVFEQEDQVERDTERRQWVYHYKPKDGQPARQIVYKPGDAFWARLPLKENQVFTWARSHSAMYAFQSLTREPRLHKANEANIAGKVAEGVTLEILPKDGVPRIPDLMPIVPAKLVP